MSWDKFSTTPVGWGVTGGSATLAASGGRSQVVRAETAAPQIWCVRLTSTALVQFAFTVGNGQSAQAFTVSVNGSQFVNVIGSTIDVDALNNNAFAASVTASAAPANGPGRSPDTATNATRALVAGVPQTVLASGRTFAIIHNDTAAVLQVRVNSLTFANIAVQGNYRLDYAGAFQLFSAAGGNVNVAEFWT